MTKKLAIFVEGQTELHFVLKAVTCVAKEKALYVSAHKIGGGSHRVKLYKMPVAQVGDADTAEVHVQIVDCANDERVISYIREEHPSLVNAGFSAVLGLRDLRPDFTLAELPQLKTGMSKALAGLLPVPEITVAVQEVEAWFIAEATHFERLDPILTPDEILKVTNIDPRGDTELIEIPSKSLNEFYAIAGLSYNKSKADVERTTDALDIESLIAVSPQNAPSADDFLTKLRALI